jgi:hypothetical protein
VSVSFSAVAIIGVELDPKALYTREMVRTCNHPVSGADKFCPHCGKQVWTERRAPIPEYDVENGKLFEMRVFSTGEEDHKRYFTGVMTPQAGIYVGMAQKANLSDTPDVVANTKAALEQLLLPLGLWKERSFGLWVVMDCG